MSTSTVGLYLRHLALSEEVSRLGTVGDHELLAAYEAERGEAAFTELMRRRHGPMVLRTCRRILGHGPDAEDAFQATFVLLVRKAGQIHRAAAGRRSVGGWLHRVAYQTALNVLTGTSRRRNHERRAVAMTHTDADPVAEATWNEIRPILDAELDTLPDDARQLLIACYLQGKTHAELAAEFAVPLGSVAWRLEKARALLAERLVRRGVAVSGVLLAVLLGEAVKGAGVPALLLVHSVEAVRTFSELSLGSVSENVAGLVKCGLANMAKGSLSWSTALIGWIGLLGAGLIACQTLKALPKQASPSGVPPAPPAERAAQLDAPVRKDRLGDPLPPGALARLGTLRLRQATGVHSLGFTAEGKSLLTAGQGDWACLWDLSSGRLLRSFGGRGDNSLLSAALSPDGRILAGRAICGDLCLWDANAGTLLHRLKGQRLATGAKVPLAFSPDGKTLISKDGNTLRLWQTATGQSIWTLEQARVVLAAYTADGKTLIWSGGYSGDLHLCDVATGKELRRWDDEQKRSISVLTRSPNGRVFTVYGWRGPVAGLARLWDVAADKEVWRLENEEAAITAAAISPDGKILATARNGGPIQLRDAATGKELRRCDGSGSAQCLTFSPDGKTLASGGGSTFGNSTDQMVHLWNVATGREIRHALDGHRAAVCSAAFTPDGKDIVSRGWEGSLRVWDAATGEQRRLVPLAGDKSSESGSGVAVTRAGMVLTPFARNSMDSTAISRDGKTLVSAAWDQREAKIHIKIRRWDRESGREQQGWSRELDKGSPALLVFSSGAERLACLMVGTVPGQVYLWETATGKELSRIAGSYPAFSGDGRLLATAPLGGRNGAAGSFTIWNAATAKELCSAKVPEGRVFRILFSPDGRSLATMSYGNPRPTIASTMTIPSLIHVWPLLRDESQKGGLRLGSPRLLPGGVPPRRAGAWAFSPDGRTLAVAGEGGNVRLLETAAGKERGCFTGHGGDVLALSFAPDGRRVASASRDTTLLVWDVTARLQDGRLRPAQLPAEALERCWGDLASEDAQRAARAVWTLTAAPSQAVPYLVEHLRIATKEFKDRATLVPQLIRDLDDDAFTVRDKAKTELARLGEAAEPALRQALGKASSLEMRRSLEQLLKEIETRRQAPSGESLRSVRVLEVLEQIGTREARAALKALTAGTPLEASLTREIHAALDRLDRAERQ